MKPRSFHHACAALAVATAALLGTSQHAAAQAFPAKPIMVKVAFPAGGPADASIRAAAVVLQRELKQSLIAESMPGASGSIAAMYVNRAAPDGYTVLGTTGIDFIVAPMTVGSAKYQADAFRLLGIVGISDFVLVSSTAHNFKNVDELLAYAASPANKPLSIGHWGTGSAPHLVGADFQARTGAHFLEVPYKGAAPTTVDIAGGQIDLSFMPLGGPTLGMIQSGKIKAIGLASPKRNPALPNVPTLGEHAKLKGFEYALWSALLAPPKTPDTIVAQMNKAMNVWISSPENAERIATNASRKLDTMSPDEATAFLKAEMAKFSNLAKALKLEPQ